MKARIFQLLGIAAGIATLLAATTTRAEAPRNIVMMIGDGMGLAQITAGKTVKGSLALEAFKTVGLVMTQSHGDEYITDSAASATALATGVLSYNGAIGVGPDGAPHQTALELAQAQGMRTGLVAACSITHATPACYVAHVAARTMQIDIASQISHCGADLILGGGWGWFLPQSAGGRREDGRNLIEAMRKKGYRYVTSAEQFAALDLTVPDQVLGLFADDHLGTAQERDPSLAVMTRAALQFLSSSGDGFFLLVEGSQIDWACHDNDAAQVPIEMCDFDDAIAEAIAFVAKRDDTLIIVTADHETGGYVIVDGSLKDKQVTGSFSTNEHTGTMIPLFAMGPGAENFGGICSHADVGKTMLSLLENR